METFLRQLKERRGDLDGDIFEMLYTLSGRKALARELKKEFLFCLDFLAFKEMFVDYALMKREGGPDLSDLLSVSSIPID